MVEGVNELELFRGQRFLRLHNDICDHEPVWPSVLIIFKNVIIIILLALGCVLYKFNLFIHLYFFIKIKMKHKISR